MNETVPKDVVKKILERILEIYNSDDARQKTDFFERELPNYIASGDFSWNPREENELNDREEE